VSADFKCELVVTDTDVVTVGEICARADSLALYLDTVGRSQIHDHETGSGVDDDGVVATDQCRTTRVFDYSIHRVLVRKAAGCSRPVAQRRRNSVADRQFVCGQGTHATCLC
jgi:hypothetical protein